MHIWGKFLCGNFARSIQTVLTISFESWPEERARAYLKWWSNSPSSISKLQTSHKTHHHQQQFCARRSYTSLAERDKKKLYSHTRSYDDIFRSCRKILSRCSQRCRFHCRLALCKTEMMKFDGKSKEGRVNEVFFLSHFEIISRSEAPLYPCFRVQPQDETRARLTTLMRVVKFFSVSGDYGMQMNMGA